MSRARGYGDGCEWFIFGLGVSAVLMLGGGVALLSAWIGLA